PTEWSPPNICRATSAPSPGVSTDALSSKQSTSASPSRQRQSRRCPTASSNCLRLDGKQELDYRVRSPTRLFPTGRRYSHYTVQPPPFSQVRNVTVKSRVASIFVWNQIVPPIATSTHRPASKLAKTILTQPYVGTPRRPEHRLNGNNRSSRKSE